MTCLVRLFRLFEPEPAAAHSELSPRGYDMYPVRRKSHPLFGSHHVHRGVTAQHVGEKRRAVGGNMHDHHEGESAIGRNGGEELLECPLAAGGSTDADHEAGSL